MDHFKGIRELQGLEREERGCCSRFSYIKSLFTIKLLIFHIFKHFRPSLPHLKPYKPLKLLKIEENANFRGHCTCCVNNAPSCRDHTGVAAARTRRVSTGKEENSRCSKGQNGSNSPYFFVSQTYLPAGLPYKEGVEHLLRSVVLLFRPLLSPYSDADSWRRSYRVYLSLSPIL